VARDPAVYGEYIKWRARRLCERQARVAYPRPNPAVKISKRIRTGSIVVIPLSPRIIAPR
jgi:hypothetical protein